MNIDAKIFNKRLANIKLYTMTNWNLRDARQIRYVKYVKNQSM